MAFFTADSTRLHASVRRAGDHDALIPVRVGCRLDARAVARKDARMDLAWLVAAFAFTLFAVVLARFVGE